LKVSPCTLSSDDGSRTLVVDRTLSSEYQTEMWTDWHKVRSIRPPTQTLSFIDRRHSTTFVYHSFRSNPTRTRPIACTGVGPTAMDPRVDVVALADNVSIETDFIPPSACVGGLRQNRCRNCAHITPSLGGGVPTRSLRSQPGAKLPDGAPWLSCLLSASCIFHSADVVAYKYERARLPSSI